MSEIEQKLDTLGRAWDEFKATNAKSRDEVARLGTETAETKAHLEKLNGAIDAAQEALKAVELKLARGGADAAAERGEQDRKAVKAFREYLKSYPTAPVEFKVLIEGDQTAAGLFALPQRLNEVLKGNVEQSVAIRQNARVIATSQTSVQLPKRTGTFAAVWVGEQTSRSETTGLTYGMEEIPTHEMQAMVDISNWMLEDSSFDLEGQIGMEAAEQFAVAEGAAFVSGTGIKKPEGIVSNAAVGTTTVQTANDVTDWKLLVDIVAAVKTFYLAGSAFYANKSTIGKIRKMIDGASRPIFEPASGTLAGGYKPPTILGFPLYEVPDLDSAGSSKKPILFGNMQKAYTIVDRTGLVSLRDPYTQQGSGNVRFWFRRRVGAQVTLAEAIRIGT